MSDKISAVRGIFVIVILVTVSSVMAEDITTLKRETFKKATVTRVEPDGITITHAAGVAKIPFTDLPKEWQEKYGYDPQKAAQYGAAVANAINQYNRTEAAGKAAGKQTEDITTLKGKTFKGATVDQVEPDGITIVSSKREFVKIPFTDLSPELRDKYGYDPQKEAEFKAAVQAAIQAAAAHSKAAAAAGGEAFRKETLLNARAHQMVVKAGLPWNPITAEAAYQAAKAEDAAAQGVR